MPFPGGRCRTVGEVMSSLFFEVFPSNTENHASKGFELEFQLVLKVTQIICS